MNFDLLKYSLNNLMHRKLRSGLMVLSIFIGVMAVFSLMSFGQGLASYVDSIAEDMGKDNILVMPKTLGPPGIGGSTFSQSDLDFLSRINGVGDAAPLIYESAQVTFKKDKKPLAAFVIGMPMGPERRIVTQTFTVKLEQGRELKSGDKLSAIIGHQFNEADRVFDKIVRVNDKLTINDQLIDVVGIYAPLGNPQDDKNIYMTLEGIESLFGTTKEYNQIILQTAEGQNPSELAERVKEKFRRHRGIKKGNEDYDVQTVEDMIATFTNILTGLNGMLILIALVSILVASVNIANTMYTATLERTNEIGIMKAIGAPNSSILYIFLIEAALLGFLGGALGIFAGFLIAKAGGIAAAGAGFSALQPKFPFWLIALCLFFSGLIGAVAGYLPARQGSRLKPADALRYE